MQEAVAYTVHSGGKCSQLLEGLQESRGQAKPVLQAVRKDGRISRELHMATAQGQPLGVFHKTAVKYGGKLQWNQLDFRSALAPARNQTSTTCDY